jgi:hypothetical protein
LAGFEKKQITNVFLVLNILSVDRQICQILNKLEIEFYLYPLINQFMTKDVKTIFSKRNFWNFLINVSTINEFAEKFLKFEGFELFINYLKES